MRFNIKTVCGYVLEEEYPSLFEKFNIFRIDEEKSPPFYYEIEIESIEEIISLIMEVGCQLIINDKTIIIYDDYYE